MDKHAKLDVCDAYRTGGGRSCCLLQLLLLLLLLLRFLL